MIVLWIAIGICALGMLFVLSMCILARISDLRMQQMVREMQEESEPLRIHRRKGR